MVDFHVRKRLATGIQVESITSRVGPRGPIEEQVCHRELRQFTVDHASTTVVEVVVQEHHIQK